MDTRRSTAAVLAVLALAAPSLISCQSAYFSAMEKFGYAKREILVDRVEDAQEQQQKAKHEFVATYERFQALTGFQGGKLEDTFDELNDGYEGCAERADTVREKIAGIEDVADAMFSEWKQEIGQYSDKSLARKSQETLDETKARYNELIASMKNASASMDPVLAAFKDRVLFLKHNLNSQAIHSLSETSAAIQGDVSKLIADMQASIDEADEFLGTMKSQG
jgi:gas vesicle protein